MESDLTTFNIREGRQEGIVTDITKDKSVPIMTVPTETLESVANPGGVFGDTESGRLPHIAMVPIVAL